MTSSMHTNFQKQFRTLEYVHQRQLTMDSPRVEGKIPEIKMTLHPHQQAMLHAMEQHEQKLLSGWDISGQTFYSTYGILGDSVGVGKSLMILGHIARLKHIPQIPPPTTIDNDSYAHNFSTTQHQYKNVTEAGCLIVIPHTLFRQWSNYIQKQTSLNAFLIDKKNKFEAEDFKKNLLESDVVLVSNTLYKNLSVYMKDLNILWKRVFIDEADTIHLVSGYAKPQSRFLWFVTASWMNLLYPNQTLYITQQMVDTMITPTNAPFHFLKDVFKGLQMNSSHYQYLRYYLVSMNFFREYFTYSHKLRGYLVLKCEDSFIQQSISLPPLTRRNVLCRQTYTHRMVADLIPAEIRNLLHAGDYTAAIDALGVKSETQMSLIEAVTQNRKKELDRLQKTYTFKSSIEYASAQSKETALKSLEEKIVQIKSQIQAIEDRIQNSQMCPICYDDECTERLVTPCCTQVFCSTCILTSLSRKPECPMCRAPVKLKELTKLVAADATNAIVESGTSSEEVPQMEKKNEALLRILKENPKGRFLIFSRYDNPFAQMESDLTALSISVKQVKGNKDAIASTLNHFEKGDIRCLLLNSSYAGAGLNITSASHVILYHAMTVEEEKQILGRAYRMGRKDPLELIRLLHEDEVQGAE